MRITFLFSAQDNAIIAVLGDKLEQGAIATAFNGTEKAGTLDTGAKPIDVIDDVISQFRANPESVGMYFLLKGGQVNDKDASHYRKLASIDLDDGSEPLPSYVAE